MKRHTTEAPRYGHHERASIAEKLSRLARKVARPARLRFIAFQAQRSDEYFSALVDMHETILKLMAREHRRRVEISAKRMAVERGVA